MSHTNNRKYDLFSIIYLNIYGLWIKYRSYKCTIKSVNRVPANPVLLSEFLAA